MCFLSYVLLSVRVMEVLVPVFYGGYCPYLINIFQLTPSPFRLTAVTSTVRVCLFVLLVQRSLVARARAIARDA